VNSKFTSNMSFEHPNARPAIPTYRVMDSDGVVVDKTRDPPDVKDEEMLKWYKDMLTGMSR
jgi:2-oxoisovalerate dehydrogenase E1 component alpha subunit